MLTRDDFLEGGPGNEGLPALYEELGERAAAGAPFGTESLIIDEKLREHHALIARLDAEAEEAPEDVRAAVLKESYLRVAMFSRRRRRAATSDEDPAWDVLYEEERAIERAASACASV